MRHPRRGKSDHFWSSFCAVEGHSLFNISQFFDLRTRLGLTVYLLRLDTWHTQETPRWVDELRPFDEDEESCPTAQDVEGGDKKDQFNRYIRGLCVICNEGSFDQMLDVLFRGYAVARNDGTISRREMAAILANHVVYDDSEVMMRPFDVKLRTSAGRMSVGGSSSLEKTQLQKTDHTEDSKC